MSVAETGKIPVTEIQVVTAGIFVDFLNNCKYLETLRKSKKISFTHLKCEHRGKVELHYKKIFLTKKKKFFLELFFTFYVICNHLKEK